MLQHQTIVFVYAAAIVLAKPMFHVGVLANQPTCTHLA
jgi:hypothetical protein